MTVLKKAITILILIIIIFFLSNQYVKAGDTDPNECTICWGAIASETPTETPPPSIDTPTDTPPSPSDGGNDSNDNKWGVVGNIHHYPGQFISPANCSCDGGSCVRNPSTHEPSGYFSINLYDAYNKNFDDYMLKNTKIIAGTSIGADLSESRSIYWSASSSVVHQCTCTRKGIVGYVTTCTKKYGCTDWPVWGTTYENYTGYSWSSACQEQANREAYNMAKREVEKNGASYSLSVTDPNEARCGNYDKYGDQLLSEGYECQNYNVSAVAGETTSYEESLKNGGKVTKTYHYEMYGACINVKTGKVRYLNKDDSCSKDEEYYIENDNENESKRHWHIFTPLNTKSTDGYILAFTSNDKSIQNEKICQATIEKYSKNNEYMLYIKPIKGSFIGNKIIDKQKVAADNGCLTQTILKINTTQKFYGEEITEDSDILKGFNFYYRPIDIDNPFPNGINDDSYWKTWSEDEDKDPNLKESFNQITYWTNNIDLNSIREYNEENSYLDWENMNIDGTSSFITDYINRSSTINKNSVYNLGCAPTNMCEYYIKDGEKVENPVYQPECKNAKIGVSCP